MATTPTRLMSFEEFAKLPDPAGGRLELRHGEPVFVPPPIHQHHLIQRRLLRLLDRAAGSAGEVSMEFGYRPRGDHEYRVSDVIFLIRERWDTIPRKGLLSGSPELVVEVLSPSNTMSEMHDKRKLCLGTGSKEFWIVDGDTRQIDVSTPDGHTVTYTSGQSVPLLFGGSLAVDEVFA